VGPAGEHCHYHRHSDVRRVAVDILNLLVLTTQLRSVIEKSDMSLSLLGRHVLVTGAGGFIGSHLTEQLVRAGAKVRALVHYNGRNDWAHLEKLDADVRDSLDVVSGDIRDPFFVQSIVSGCDVIFHLAALIPIPYSYMAPAEFVSTNISGTLNVLEAARRHGTARVLHTSTSETYGTAIYTPINEKHPLQGQSPYSATKIGADKIAESYYRSFGTPVVTVRPFNTYGPRQSARAFIPTVVTQALSRDVIRVGSLDPVRDMTYVADTADGFVRAASAPDIEGMTINLGSGRAVTMGALLRLILEVVGRNVPVEEEQARKRPTNSEVMQLIADATIAHEKLGWTNRVPLEQGVARTVEWIREHLAEYKPHMYVI
jgi:NAD dependent epimerase/dehydratase